MQWLQSMDTALFHFINSTLANPFFDWLMPIASGRGVPWLIAVIIAIPLVLLFGSRRLKVCVLLMVIIISLGNALVIDTVKKAVARPRPFVTLPDARQFGKTGAGFVPPMADGTLPATASHNSMPSAHAANCFALATVAFLFYRRSGRFLFPLAALVAFSRVYNGVHYPSDVLAGAILGAGYAIALLVVMQTAWNFIGKKYFPAWHEEMPSLLNPESKIQNSELPQSEIRNPKSEIEWLHLGYFIIIAALIGRWIYIGSGIISLSEDEAYQWLWSKHLALSYYSKPPGIAYIQWLGTSLFGDTDFGVRFFSPLFGAVLSWLVLNFMAREIGGRRAFLFLMLTFATPLLVAGSILMTIDPPLVLCWMWAVIAGWRALQPDGKTRDWFIVGVATGLGFLCKYSALFLPICFGIYFALQPVARAHLRKPGPWLALGLLGLSTLPVVIWNAQHGWSTIEHLAGNAGLKGRWHPTLQYFFEFLGSEAGLLNPIFFFGMMWACFAFWKTRREKPLQLFLFCMGAPVFFGYWLFTFHSHVLANWIAPAVPPLFCFMVLYWSDRRVNLKPWLATGMGLGLFIAAFMYDSYLLGKVIGKLPGDKDPSHRVRGWREMSKIVESERAKFDPHAFIIAEHYGPAGLLSFYSSPAHAAATTGNQPLVYAMDNDQPMNQFYFWDDYNYRAQRHGQNALFIRRLEAYPLESGWIWKWLKHEPLAYGKLPRLYRTPPRITSEFETITNLGVREVVMPDGRIFQRVQLFGCYHLK
jgi:membrane-associated phospholipid phosphatase